MENPGDESPPCLPGPRMQTVQKAATRPRSYKLNDSKSNLETKPPTPRSQERGVSLCEHFDPSRDPNYCIHFQLTTFLIKNANSTALLGITFRMMSEHGSYCVNVRRGARERCAEGGVYPKIRKTTPAPTSSEKARHLLKAFYECIWRNCRKYNCL